jgi:cytoskeletal protein RodZ
MTLQKFGTSLREQREQKNITLAEISAYTRINLKFLEAIESGNFSALPQTYIRAFLREYAAAIDVSPDEILETYHREKTGQPSETRQRRSSQSDEPEKKKEASASSHPLTPFVRALKPVVFGAIIVIIAGFMYLMLKSPSETTQTAAGEIPFDRVIRETEAALPQDTIPTYVAPQPTLSAQEPVDSLVLIMTTTDSLWISITIDNTRNEEYLFAPNRRRTFRAESRFLLTMGNAGGATFQLNGKDLGALGRTGAVLRNRVITADLLR